MAPWPAARMRPSLAPQSRAWYQGPAGIDRMTAPLKTVEADIAAVMREIGSGRARLRARLALAPTAQKDKALAAMAEAIRAAQGRRFSPPTPRTWPRPRRAAPRGASSTASRSTTSASRPWPPASRRSRALADPVGAVIESWTRPNGLTIERVRMPLGVIGIIYESRPNVTADAGALCLKAGNAAILRGGSDSHRSQPRDPCRLADGLARRPACRRTRSSSCRPATAPRSALMLAGLDGAIDVIVPRGGKSLVARVQAGGAGAGLRASRRHLPRLCRHGRRPRHGEDDRGQRQDAAHRRLRRGRDAADRPRRRADASASRWSTMLLDAGCEVRGDDATRGGRCRA